MQYERLTKNRIYIFAAHEEMQKSADTAYAFQQDPVFYWLTNIIEPGWRVVINTYAMKCALLRPDRSEVKTIFEGALSDKEVMRKTGISEIIPSSKSNAYINELASRYSEVYTIAPLPKVNPYDFIENPSRKQVWKTLGSTFKQVHDCRKEIAQLRAIKQPHEIEAIKKAVDISVRGFEMLKQKLESSRFEYELEALLNSEFRRTGAGGHAYDPIVAGGKNACTLHYCTNNDTLPKSGLILIDAGAKVDGFAADITRTYAIGAPSERQKEIHAAVEAAHLEIIDLILPGVSLDEYQKKVDTIMKSALQKVGLLRNLDDEKTYRTYFPHAIGHGLGIDVHESLGGFDSFQPGMVLTVEPGIYIPEEGIGVRIEDDILVTETGTTNLSAKLPTSL